MSSLDALLRRARRWFFPRVDDDLLSDAADEVRAGAVTTSSVAEEVFGAARDLGERGAPLMAALVESPRTPPGARDKAMTALVEGWPSVARAVVGAHASHLPPYALWRAVQLVDVEEAFVLLSSRARAEPEILTGVVSKLERVVCDARWIDVALAVLRSHPLDACRVLVANASPRAIEELRAIVEGAPPFDDVSRAALDALDDGDRRDLVIPWLADVVARACSQPEQMEQMAEVSRALGQLLVVHHVELIVRLGVGSPAAAEIRRLADEHALRMRRFGM